jgi:hypothetical protein
MHKELVSEHREHLTHHLECDLAIIGGGMAGVCGAITAARAGIRVVLIQDRPILGGNASSEVRVWILGATSHMGNNNRWSREGGVIDEILVENTYRNPEGNPVILDTILLEKVKQEANITLLLNTVVFDISKSTPNRIDSLQAFCSQSSILYDVRAPLFCDASGDGVVAFLSGASFRMGAESQAEFGEKLAPSRDYGGLLGHSLFFYSKDTGKPVKFIPPSYALQDITQIPRYRSFSANEHGIRLWWIEYGGRLDTVHDSEEIKWELWKIVYGVWNYIKNSGKFPEAESLTLEWVGQIPGKRESRRFEGDYILTQQDIIDRNCHADAVAYGGWALDLHPADGIYSEKPGCSQWHSRGVYQIPYRCLYSKNVENLFLAGRIISASHVAFGSIRVQATLAQAAQAVGMAAALCTREGLVPADISRPPHIKQLQNKLLQVGQFIPGAPLKDDDNLAHQAKITSTSRFILDQLPPDGPWLPLTYSVAQLLPVSPGAMPEITFQATTNQPADLRFELRTSRQPDEYTPDQILDVQTIHIEAGDDISIPVRFTASIDQARYVFVCVMKNAAVSMRCSKLRITGILSAANKSNHRVSNYGKQAPVEDIGVDSFEFWCPERRPEGHNLAMTIKPALDIFHPENVVNGWNRPTCGPNAWLADLSDPLPTLKLEWDAAQEIARLNLGFDTDFDHPMESVMWGHPERVMPFCVRHYRIRDENGRVITECMGNHSTRNSFLFEPAIKTRCIQIEVLESHGPVPAAIFEVGCYSTHD